MAKDLYEGSILWPIVFNPANKWKMLPGRKPPKEGYYQLAFRTMGQTSDNNWLGLKHAYYDPEGKEIKGKVFYWFCDVEGEDDRLPIINKPVAWKRIKKRN